MDEFHIIKRYCQQIIQTPCKSVEKVIEKKFRVKTCKCSQRKLKKLEPSSRRKTKFTVSHWTVPITTVFTLVTHCLWQLVVSNLQEPDTHGSLFILLTTTQVHRWSMLPTACWSGQPTQGEGPKFGQPLSSTFHNRACPSGSCRHGRQHVFPPPCDHTEIPLCDPLTSSGAFEFLSAGTV